MFDSMHQCRWDLSFFLLWAVVSIFFVCCGCNGGETAMPVIQHTHQCHVKAPHSLS